MGRCVLFAVIAIPLCLPLVFYVSEAKESAFADLSVEEMNQINDYLFKQQDIKLQDPTKAHLSDAVIFLIEAIRPPKAEALEYLDKGASAPERAARVIIHRGDLPTAIIEEYRVFPIPNPTIHKLIKNPSWRHPIPFSSRSFEALPDYYAINKIVEREMMQINDILSEMTGGWTYSNCTDLCLMWAPAVPPHAEANHHKIMPYISKNIEGNYLHPIGVQFVLNMESLDIEKWYVEHVWFQGQHFRNFNMVWEAYRHKTLRVLKIPEAEGLFTKNQMSSLNFRGAPRPVVPKRGPRSFMPDGQRFTINKQQISWLGWEFEFSMLASSGIQIYNVKFQKERIVYELSLQEVGVFYSGGSPVASHNSYYDSFMIIGLQSSELFIGIDCPNHAHFFDVVQYMNGKPHIIRNSVCVFEHNRGVPLHRHFASDSKEGYTYANGMPDNVLILRQVLTVDNYDYIIDFMFHQAGQIEGKVTLTGYLLSTFYTGPTMDKYGYVVNAPNSTANIHHHIVHLKADLDIHGQINRFATLDIKLEEIMARDELSETFQSILNPYFEKSVKKTEKEGAYLYNFSTPKYLVMYNKESKNKFGHSKGYRILSDGMSKVLLPRTYNGFRSRAWAEYQVAVSKQKDHEQCSSTIYSTMEPFDPVMSFEDFINDDESIVDQDLVAWIAMGAHHIPHTEDVPIVTTQGVQLTFYLLPYNYFDEDPSSTSHDNIRVTLKQNGKKHYEYGYVGADHDKRMNGGRTPQTSNTVTSTLLLLGCATLILFPLLAYITCAKIRYTNRLSGPASL